MVYPRPPEWHEGMFDGLSLPALSLEADAAKDKADNLGRALADLRAAKSCWSRAARDLCEYPPPSLSVDWASVRSTLTKLATKTRTEITSRVKEYEEARTREYCLKYEIERRKKMASVLESFDYASLSCCCHHHHHHHHKSCG